MDMSRRAFLTWSALGVAGADDLLSGKGTVAACDYRPPAKMPNLDAVALAHFNYFRAQSDARTGLTRDRSRQDSSCSIAACGFSLTAHCVAVARNWMRRKEAAEYTLRTLSTLWHAPQGDAPTGTSGRDGFFYHFLDVRTATRYAGCEVSTIDTALLMAGVRAVGCFFDGGTATEREIRRLSDKLYRRVEWNQAVTADGQLSHGWTPERGMLKPVWTGYCEAAILVLLASGSPTHPVPATVWSKFMSSTKIVEHYGHRVFEFGPLFGHQYSHCWIDFRNVTDRFARAAGIDYFENSRRSTLIQHRYAIDNPRGFRGYSKLDWGLTACDGPGWDAKMVAGQQRYFHAYAARGFPNDLDDGTIAPTAALASLPFAPEIVLPTLKHWLNNRPELWTRFGFADAFNPTYDLDKPSGWVAPDVLGIDQGPIVLMIENYRSGLVWKIMRRDPYLRAGLRRAGFSGGWL